MQNPVKSFLSIPQQLEHLKAAGMHVEDESTAAERMGVLAVVASIPSMICLLMHAAPGRVRGSFRTCI